MITNSVLRALLFACAPEGFFGLPFMLWSDPGVGKTSLIRAVAAAAGLPLLRLSPAERGEGYFGCVPVPTPDGTLTFPPPSDLISTFKGGRGVLFLDEINLAGPHVQSSLLGAIQLRSIGTHTMPNGVRVVGAANQLSDAAGGFDLKAATANRMAHYDYNGLDPEDWAAGLISGFRTPQSAFSEPAQAIEERVIAAWPEAHAEAVGLVSAFIKSRPTLLHKRLPKGSPERAWPSRRSVEYLTCAIASAKIQQLDESDTDYLLGGFVGDAWIGEFRSFTEFADLPSTTDLLDEKVKFQHDERRPDRTLAVLSACAAYLVPEAAQKRKERSSAFWRLIAATYKQAPDFVVMPARQVAAAGLVFIGSGTASTNALSSLHQFLTMAGVIPR